MIKPTPRQAAAIATLSSFVAARAAMRGLDPEYVCSIHTGINCANSHHIRMSDLRAVLAMFELTPTETPTNED